jgi:hypothetical protein
VGVRVPAAAVCLGHAIGMCQPRSALAPDGELPQVSPQLRTPTPALTATTGGVRPPAPGLGVRARPALGGLGAEALAIIGRPPPGH